MAEASSVPVRSLEVELHIRQAPFGLRRWRGILNVKMLPDEQHAFGTLWMEVAKQGGLALADYPCARARSRETLVKRLRAIADGYGRVVRCVEVRTEAVP